MENAKIVYVNHQGSMASKHARQGRPEVDAMMVWSGRRGLRLQPEVFAPPGDVYYCCCRCKKCIPPAVQSSLRSPQSYRARRKNVHFLHAVCGVFAFVLLRIADAVFSS